MIKESDSWVEWSSDPSATQNVNLDFMPSGGLEVYVDRGEADYDHPSRGIASLVIPAAEVDAFLEALGALWLSRRRDA